MVDFYHAKNIEEKFYKIWNNRRYFKIHKIENISKECLSSIKIKKACIKLFLKYNIYKIIKNEVIISFRNKSKNIQKLIFLNKININFIISKLNLKNPKKLELGK